MTYDEYISDATYPDRSIVEIDLNSQEAGDFDGHDCQSAVIDVHYLGQHFVVVPFVMPNEMTLEVAMFDRSGQRVQHRLFSVMDSTNPFAIGGEP